MVYVCVRERRLYRKGICTANEARTLRRKINSCSPGYILTDMTRGMGASLPPEKGTKVSCAASCSKGESKESAFR